MLIYGLDITSAPSKTKPITSARASISGKTLTVVEIEKFGTFSEFENFLQRPGPWCAGFDFPFGQPRKLLINLGLSGDWVDSVTALTQGEMTDFTKLLDEYRRPRLKGDKQHLRKVDEKAKSCSPMTLYYTPVGKMYFRCAPRLLKAGVCIVPVHRNRDLRVSVEAYPRLVADRYSSGGKYKHDSKKKQTKSMREVRENIIGGLERHGQRDFGFTVKLIRNVRFDAVHDPTGDTLDAILCSVQAAWFNLNPLNAIPRDCDLVEGWIVDPVCVPKT